ncbi:MAG: hypothetical protein JSV06_13815 [Myxococcales bacterium]|nr:MAG: hypothetical protein JSV06_13815 [Myxococcales bacterium]
MRTDAFCGTCGEPVPGAKPVVPIARQPNPSGVQTATDRVTGAFPPPTATGTSARAVAVVPLSEPEEPEPPDTGLSRTTIREREQSEPAPVLPLHRRKDGTASQSELVEATAEPQAEEARLSMPERDTSLPNVPVPAGPPILASDLLREQMRPSSPGEKTLRVVTVSLCAIGVVAALLAGGAHPLTFVSAALLVMMATLALTPSSYRARAISLALAGATATSVALWQQTVHGLEPESIILAGATILLSGSLLFRAYYRGARFARFAVALGVVALIAWFVVSGGHESLVMLEGHWQSWAPATTHMTFSLLALLSLMAFMESSTRGGSHVWAVALLVLYAVHISLMIASEVWPVPGVQPTIQGPTIATLLTGMVGTIVAGLALAQVFVAIYQKTSRGFSRPGRE